MFKLLDENQDCIKLIGIDPGSQYLGVGILYIDPDTLNIRVSEALSFNTDKLPIQTKDKWYNNKHSDRFVRIRKQKQNLLEVFRIVRPNYVSCEAPFFNPRRPGAAFPLVELLTAIRMALFEYNDWLSLDLVDPATIKKSVGAPGNADKIKMREKVLELKELNYHDLEELKNLDEHAIDSLSVAYLKHTKLLKEKYVSEYFQG